MNDAHCVNEVKKGQRGDQVSDHGTEKNVPRMLPWLLSVAIVCALLIFFAVPLGIRFLFSAPAIRYESSSEYQDPSEREGIRKTGQVVLDYPVTSEDLEYLADLPPGPDYMLMDCRDLNVHDFDRAFGSPMPLLCDSLHFNIYRGGAAAIRVLARSGVSNSLNFNRCRFTSYRAIEDPKGSKGSGSTRSDLYITLNDCDGVDYAVMALVGLDGVGRRLRIAIQGSQVSDESLWILLRSVHVVSLSASPRNRVDHEALQAYAEEHGKEFQIRPMIEAKPLSSR